MRMTKALLGLALVLALAVPTPAFAQSAGDDQYVDPFQEEPAPPQDGGDQGGGGDQGTVAPEPAPAEPVAPAPDSGVVPDSSVVPEAGTTTVAPSEGATLPRTGLPAGGLALMGGLLLAAGLALRRSA